MSTPMVTFSKGDRYSTGLTVENDYGRAVLVKITSEVDDNPAEYTVTVNIDELIAGLAVIAARMDRK